MERLIMVADSPSVNEGIVPKKRGTIAAGEYEVLSLHPYELTKDQLFFQVHHVYRNRPHLKIGSYLLVSMELPKRYGWGLHVNVEGKIGLVACDSEEYLELITDPGVKKSKAFASR